MLGGCGRVRFNVRCFLKSQCKIHTADILSVYIKIFPLSSADHKQVIGRLQCKSALQGAGGWGVLLYMDYIGICCGIGYGV